MSTEQNKNIVRRMLESVTTGDSSIVDELIAPNWVNHDPSLPPMQGRDGARQLFSMFNTAFPDMKVMVDRIIAEGDRVGAHFSFTGSNTGSFMGVPATGKKVNVVGAGVFRVVDGKLTDNWVNFDAMTMMQQLGLAPTPGPAT